MLDQLETLAQTAQTELGQIKTGDNLNAWNSKYIGRRGEITQMLRRVSELPKEDRPLFGKRANQLKKELEAGYEDKAATIKATELEQTLAEGALDVTLPGRSISRGRLHPSSQTLRRIYQIWAEMGFQVFRSRDVETDEMNFLSRPDSGDARLLS
jgi:phenylalanyl-tRNA synthetase alpha chain